jgi:hypothetical protein
VLVLHALAVELDFGFDFALDIKHVGHAQLGDLPHTESAVKSHQQHRSVARCVAAARDVIEHTSKLAII